MQKPEAKRQHNHSNSQNVIKGHRTYWLPIIVKRHRCIPFGDVCATFSLSPDRRDRSTFFPWSPYRCHIFVVDANMMMSRDSCWWAPKSVAAIIITSSGQALQDSRRLKVDFETHYSNVIYAVIATFQILCVAYPNTESGIQKYRFVRYLIFILAVSLLSIKKHHSNVLLICLKGILKDYSLYRYRLHFQLRRCCFLFFLFSMCRGGLRVITKHSTVKWCTILRNNQLIYISVSRE